MTNRKHGDGSLSYDKTRKRWQVAFFDSTGKRHYKRFADKKAAQAYLTEQLNDINHGTFVAPSDMTVGQWIIEWISTYKKNTVKQTTYDYYVFLCDYISAIAKIKLQDLQSFTVQKFYDDLIAVGLSKATTYKVHAMLKSAYKKAYTLGLIQKDIMLAVSAPKVDKKTIEIFNRAEINTILNTTQQIDAFKPRYPIVLIAVTTGMRLGEILGLRWCDIDLVKNEIHVRHTLSKSVRTGLSLTSPKTRAGVRKISIPLEVSDVLRDKKKDVQSMDIREETFIFTTRRGTLVNMRTLEKSWERILHAAGVPYRKFHALRHTHATTLLAEGVPIVEVSRRLGHAKVAHTLDLYGQAIKGYDKKIADKISTIYSL